MKIYRLYALTLYLLDRGKTFAPELAKHFEVSVWTIIECTKDILFYTENYDI